MDYRDILDEKTGLSERIRYAVGWAMDILAAVLAALFVVYFFGMQIGVTGEAMSPTLSSGDTVLINRLAYSLRAPARFDIAAVQREDGSICLRRIAGLPGETVQISSGRLYINGEELSYPVWEDIFVAGLAADEVELAEDEYFILGDSTVSGGDSRSADTGNIQVKNMLGKAWFCLTPAENFGFLR